MEQKPNTYPASEEPLIQVFIKKFLPKPTTNDRIILHKNGKLTRNGYEVIVLSEDEEAQLRNKKKQNEEKIIIQNLFGTNKIGKFKDKYKK